MKEQLKKFVAFVTSALMALALVPGIALAAGTGTITINPPANTPAETTNTYKIYKVFDADGNGTSISYKLSGNDTLSDAMRAAGFSVDGAGNVTGPETLNENAIAAIASYVTEADLVDTATSTGTTPAVSKALADGFYYIATSTGTAVTINSVNTKNIEVNDKNNVPAVDKTITGVNDGSYDADGKAAIAQVGTKVSYKSEITVTGNTKNLKFEDTPGSGLSLDTESLKVQVNGTDVATNDYSSSITATGISISFDDDYIASLSAGTKIDVTYTATITSSALTTSSDAGKNTASITYGDNNAKVTDEKKPTVYNATVTVNKTFDGLDKDASLANNDSAQFVLTKTVSGATKYYSIANNVVSWVDSLDAATKVTITKDGTGDGAFTGLADGNYTLVESKVPAGYNKATDTAVTIASGNVTAENLSQTKNIENKTGSALPTTGGMGTTLFTVVGAALVVAAGVLLVTRRRMQQ